MNIVEDTLSWEEMEGDTEEMQKINSLLTSEFIGSHNMPSDECLTYAEYLCELDDLDVTEIEDYLVECFGDLYDDSYLVRNKKRFECVAEEVVAILLGEE